MPYDPQNALEMAISDEIGYGTINAVPQSVAHLVHTFQRCTTKCGTCGTYFESVIQSVVQSVAHAQ